MAGQDVFISHSTKDDEVVAAIRTALESLGLSVWDDARRLTAGDQLEPAVRAAIESARHFVAVLSVHAVNSRWVHKEIQYALQVQKQRTDGFKVIPVLLPGIEPGILPLLFAEEPVALKISVGPGGIEEALPDLLAALGLRLPTDHQPSQKRDTTPIADLILKLTDPAIDESGGKRRATAFATLNYNPPDDGSPDVESKRFRFTAPLGPIETGELEWYLERYCHWPSGVFRARAEQVEKQLPEWGKLLYAAMNVPAARAPLQAWEFAGKDVERRFTVLVDSDLPDDSTKEQQNVASEAATLLLALPWELLHDERGYLFQGARGVRVRRALPNRIQKDPILTDPPIRVLLVSPRPEDDTAAYIDHRISARPLVAALSELGELATLTLLAPPTFDALQEELQRAYDAGKPYHVVHFDGHGVYDRRHGLGKLCFEDPRDATKLEKRRTHIVHADKLAESLRDYRVPLFFLEACQSAMTDERPDASVAGRLLQEGVASVVAMTHSVLVETSRRFVTAFYRKLMDGGRIGQAMLEGQRRLQADTYRGKVFRDELHLLDWFVPVLFQEELDPQLIMQVPAEQVRAVIQQRRKLSLGSLPPVPSHTFVGRSRELLTAERVLSQKRYVVLRGEGGEGKTTLAAELARWLVETERFKQAAFVSLENRPDARQVLYAIGDQLVPDFQSESKGDDKLALQLVERALSDRPTLIVLDNMESVLPPPHNGEILRCAQNDAPEDCHSERSEESRRERTPCRSSEREDSMSERSAMVVVGCHASATTSDVESSSSQERHGVRSLPFTVYEPELLEGILTLCARLGNVAHTRLIFTSREMMPAPFDGNHVAISRLDRRDAITLVGKVLGEGNLIPYAADEGESEAEVAQLVDAVNCHARSLVLLAREVAASGVRHATQKLHELMAALHARYPDNRERSLFASVELSLRRLPDATRQKLGPLGVFQGGGQLGAIAIVLGLDHEKGEHVALAQQLIGVGLAEMLPYNYLRLDPALCPFLLSMLNDQQREAARTAWAQAMTRLTSFLYQQQFKDAHLAATLIVLELPNLLETLEHLHQTADPNLVVEVATLIESLVTHLNRPQALARVAQIRVMATQQLGEWNHVRYLSEIATVERLMETGHHTEAVAAARMLLNMAETVGENAYSKAAYDLAVCYFMLGRALAKSEDAESALVPLNEARERFQKLADAGNVDAARMMSTTIIEIGDCLLILRRLNESSQIYEEAIALGTARNASRDIAVSKANLGMVRMYQGRYDEALAAFIEARETFEPLGEPNSVASTWHNIGMVFTEAQRYDAAEQAYLSSLKIKVQTGNRWGEASTLSELGSLYDAMGRWEEAVSFCQQASGIYFELGALTHEGAVRSNTADTLIKLHRYDEARQELRRAIECRKPFGHAAQLWLTFGILSDLERSVGNDTAAAEARQRAIQIYLAYRRSGGESQAGGRNLIAMVVQALHTGQSDIAAEMLPQLLQRLNLSDSAQALIRALQSVVNGSRNAALANDPNLYYADAAELRLLLESLGGTA